MKLKVIVHEAEERGYWAEVPAMPGCATQGETLQELFTNLREAIAACRSVDISEDIEAETKWDQAFAETQDQLAKLAERALEDIKAGRVRRMGFDEL